MSTDIITVDNYKFDLELSPPQIKIKLTDTTSYDMYEGIVNEDDIYVKPIQKFYSMIIKSLNKEPNYNFKMNDKKTTLICTISYSTEMIDIDEHIKFTKIEDQKTKELLLIDRIKYLEESSTPIIGRRPYSNDIIRFDLNSTELDFRPYYISDDDAIEHYEIYDNQTENFNKYTKVKRIITNDISINGYLKQFMHFDEFQKQKLYYNPHNQKLSLLQFNFHFSSDNTMYMPSVIELIIYLQPKKFLIGQYESFSYITVTAMLQLNLKPFPNLEKLIIINNGFIPINYWYKKLVNCGHQQTPFNSSGDKYNLQSMRLLHEQTCKKIKYISLQKMSDLVDSTNLSDIKLYFQANKVELEIS